MDTVLIVFIPLTPRTWVSTVKKVIRSLLPVKKLLSQKYSGYVEYGYLEVNHEELVELGTVFLSRANL